MKLFVTDGGTPISAKAGGSSLQTIAPAGATDRRARGFPNACPSADTGTPSLRLVPAYLPLSGGDIVVQDSKP